MKAPVASRRDVLRVGAIGGALLIGASVAGCGLMRGDDDAVFTPNAFLRVDATGVSLLLPKTEMGQGVSTTIAMLVAEELNIAPSAIRIILPDGDADRFKPLDPATGGSTSVREVWKPLRQAGANARAALIEAAAHHWGVEAGTCVAKDGGVHHPPSGRALPYTELAPLAARRPLPENVPLKPAHAFTVIGKSQRRLDAAAKARGTATYGIDVARPGMRVATLAQAPAIGATLSGCDERAALAVRGVRQIVRGNDVLFVVADNYWAAKQGLEAAAPTWTAGTHAALDQVAIEGALAAACAQDGADAGTRGGDPGPALAHAARVVRADYTQSFLAHAAMEPLSCVIHVENGHATLWTGTQVPAAARQQAADALKFPLANVTVHTYLLGGGFGRRLETDMIARAAELGRQIDAPVKLIWSREEDVQHDMYRPAYHDRLEAALDASGRPVVWRHRIAGSSIMARLLADKFKGVDDDAIDGTVAPLYPVAQRRVTFRQVESGLSTGWWRGVGGLRTTFAVESFIDELAHAAGQDPVAYRRALIADARALGVLDLAAAKAGWGTPVAAGSGRGIAVLHLWDTYIAAVAEVTAVAGDDPRVTRVVAAVDCGQAINPAGIRAQVESGVLFAMAATLWGRITVAGGRVEQSNFHDYRVVRMDDAPVIETHIVSSDLSPGGLGEPPAAVIGPAIANALFAATGERRRNLPLLGSSA
ncbi:molybdopterin cofactor-binding domain-containing protein [Sphingomonas sp. TX0543]|uniref:xanthine dehydrogenase family protein molybdopterin-binding subunit n=1 Tax=unclassified Sphingomonas TaxID=196159 RepID=UPI0010F7D550|nr:molybdopterin cofactor-binding domain-containing protein [Sphingomonas sp. 3P27F8]